ncbi:uncharacterized protein LOC124806846 [Hydra vulgaris]|uniref:uncharacterized protein LOC124806846 n=1 Tax=Hydra vulgaris TaxID=6087 RepID=UPI001F5F1BB5|nr:uncharacterized protein LOC124806846 [Hydra vulgaris]
MPATAVLQLCIMSALNVQQQVKNLISLVHKIADFFNSTSIGLKCLKKHQLEQGLREYCPPLDIVTRFNSRFKLLNWSCENCTAITMALTECALSGRCAKSLPQALLEAMKDIFKKCIPFLKPISDATMLLSTDTTVAISLVKPCIYIFKNQLDSLSCSFMSSCKKELLSQLHACFNLANVTLLTSTYLDPKVKAIMHTENELLIVKNRLIEMSVDFKLCKIIPCLSSLNNNNIEKLPKIYLTLYLIKLKKKNLKNSKILQKKSIEDCIVMEMDIYVCSQTINSDNCPLEYWKKNENIFLVLAQAAQSVLAVQETSCYSERVNSFGGHVISYSRHSLSNNNAETLILAQKNKDIIF